MFLPMDDCRGGRHRDAVTQLRPPFTTVDPTIALLLSDVIYLLVGLRFVGEVL